MTAPDYHSGTVKAKNQMTITVNECAIWYRTTSQVAGIQIGDIVEYCGTLDKETSKIWLDDMRKVEGGQSTLNPPADEAKKIIQDNIDAKKNETAAATTSSGPLKDEHLSAATLPEQVIIHRHEGQESRPDSIEFSGTSKKAGLKVYFDASKPDESLERIEQAFVLYDHAVREMQKRQEAA